MNTGLKGTLKFVVMIAVVAIAALAIGFVLEVVTAEMFKDLSIKLLTVGGIVVVAGGAMAVLMKD